MQRFALVLVTALYLSAAVQAAEIKPSTQVGAAKIVLIVASIPLKVGKNILMLKVSDAQNKPFISQDFKAVITQSAQEMAAMGMGDMGMAAAKVAVKATTPGVYEIKTSLPFGGKWNLQVNIKDTKPPARANFSFTVK